MNSNSTLRVPEFIKQNQKPFLDKAFVYFTDLVKIQDFICFDAKNKGRLSQILVAGNLFKRGTLVVEVIDGVEDVHAEMRLLQKHLTTHKNTNNYYGITMLCCALCTHTVQRMHIDGERVTYARGSHGSLYPKWKLIDAIRDSHLEEFLGSGLFNKLQTMRGNRLYPPGVSITDPTNLEDKADIALFLIPALGFINDKEALKDLGIDPGYFMPGLRGALLYPLETQLVAKEYVKYLAEYQHYLKRQNELRSLLNIQLCDLQILDQFKNISKSSNQQQHDLYEVTIQLMSIYENLLCYQYILQDQNNKVAVPTELFAVVNNQKYIFRKNKL
jgi:hypothetical protein